VFHPVAVHFKGSGFYNTDYGKKSKAAAGSDSGDSKKETPKKEDSKPSAKPAKGSD
jgi:hypothetical protein